MAYVATQALLAIFIKPFKKRKNSNCINKTDSVYPISVLHIPYETCKTDHSALLYLFVRVCELDSLKIFSKSFRKKYISIVKR